MPIRAHCLGYPCIGEPLEWADTIRKSYSLRLPAQVMETAVSACCRQRWVQMHQHGIIVPPSNDFTIDNHLLDTAVMVGAVPECYQAITDPLVRYWTMAQGEPPWYSNHHRHKTLGPLPRRRWFGTLYSCSVPQLSRTQPFQLDASKILREVREARALQLETRPVIVGPMTLLLRSQVEGSIFKLLDRLLPVYEELLVALAKEQVSWVQLDEPCLVSTLSDEQRIAYQRTLNRLSSCQPRPQLMLTTYFGALGANLPLAVGSGCEGLHVDVVSAPEQRTPVVEALTGEQVLSLGVVDGRGVFRCDLQLTHAHLRCAIAQLCADRVCVASSCSLRFLPLDVQFEEGFDEMQKSELAFARQKLSELELLARYATETKVEGEAFRCNSHMLARRASALRRLQARESLLSIDAGRLKRLAPSSERRTQQSSVTPQSVVQDDIEHCAQRLSGFLVSRFGFVQIDGLRFVRPPILHHDVTRGRPISSIWDRVQLSEQPAKVILPGPMSLLHGVFRCPELSCDEAVLQLALALSTEVNELQAAGIRMVQFAETLLDGEWIAHGSDPDRYWRRAMDAMRLASAVAKPSTCIMVQIPTNTFSEHQAVLAEMDADVLVLDERQSNELMQTVQLCKSKPSGNSDH